MKLSRLILLALSLSLLLSVKGAAAADEPFIDMPQGHWAYNEVMEFSKVGLVSGFSDGSFKPDAKVTREQFAVLMARTLKLPLNTKAPQIFSDIQRSRWSFLYIDAAKSYIDTPSNPRGRFNFNPGWAISREVVAQALAMALNLEKGRTPTPDFFKVSIKDYNKINPNFHAGVAQVVYYGLMKGSPDGSFSPKAPLTRAELCVLLSRVLQKEKAVTEALKPPHKRWTIEFIDFKRPDYDMVKQFPLYNPIQKFFGTVTSKVYGFDNSYFVVKHNTIKQYGGEFRGETKTIHAYVYEEDLSLFNVGDQIIFSYDRDNNITDYELFN